MTNSRGKIVTPLALLNQLQEDSNNSRTEISTDSIVISPFQPRKYFDPIKMSSLVVSVEKHGILENLIVRALPDGNYELVAGERRLRAAKTVGLKTVPVTIIEISDDDFLDVALVENLNREDLNPYDETIGVLALLARRLKRREEDVKVLLYRMSRESKGNLKSGHIVMGTEEAEEVKSVFKTLARNWLSFVSNNLSILTLPENVLAVLREGRLEYTKAKLIAQIKDDEQRQKVLDEAIADGWTIKKTRHQIRLLKGEVTPPSVNDIQKLKSTLKGMKDLSNSSKLADPEIYRRAQSLVDQLIKLLNDSPQGE